MIRSGRITALAAMGFAMLARAAQANPGPMFFDDLSTGLICGLFFIWLLAGGLLSLSPLDLTHFGLAGYALIFVFLLSSPDTGLLIWTFYVGLLVVYYLVPRAEVPRRARVVNLAFHGFFLALIIASGIVAKVSGFWGPGGYYRWIAHMRENYFPNLFVCMILVLPVIARVFYGMARERRKRIEHTENTESTTPAPENAAHEP